MAVETGALAHSDTQGRGLLVHGQAGGVAALAQHLTGQAGPLAAGVLAPHGRAGLDALLQSPPLPSTQPQSLSALHTRPSLQPVSGTRWLRPQPQVQALLPPPLVHPAPTARSLPVAPLLQRLSVLLQCCRLFDIVSLCIRPKIAYSGMAWRCFLSITKSGTPSRRGTGYDTPHDLFLRGNRCWRWR